MMDCLPHIERYEKFDTYNHIILEEYRTKFDSSKFQGLFVSSMQNKEDMGVDPEFKNILNAFIQKKDNAYNFKCIDISIVNGVEVRQYSLTSQFWPIENQNNPAFLWRHRLIIYKPSNILYSTAFMYVSGGYNRDKQGNEKFQNTPEKLDFIGLAKRHNIIIVNLLDVPNQYLFLGDKTSPFPKHEDQIIAYTYRKVLEDPKKNAYLAGHLPMAKSIIKGKDATKEIISSEFGAEVKDFILSGASKRGWAAWLAALEDERVSALIPIVIDILNVKKNIDHICAIYGGTCPVSFKDYINEGIINSLKTENSKYLMNIEDPLSYLNPEYNAKYLNRLGIAKYIINASGDDFFAPDSSHFYFNILPGKENYIRYIPNAAHYLLGGKIGTLLKTDIIVQDTVERYISLKLKQIKLPQVSWNFSSSKIILYSSKRPQSIKLWKAYNKDSKDFRCLQIKHSTYPKLRLWFFFIKKYIASWFTEKLCDIQYYPTNINYQCSDTAECIIEVKLPKITSGFQATFLAIEYSADGSMSPFTVTTEINIVGANNT